MGVGIVILIFIAVPIVLMLLMFCLANHQYNSFMQSGVPIDAVVITNQKRKKRNAPSGLEASYYYETKVKYRTNDGKEHISKLWSSDGCEIGTQVKVLYIPGKYKSVMLQKEKKNEQ